MASTFAAMMTAASGCVPHTLADILTAWLSIGLGMLRDVGREIGLGMLRDVDYECS